LTLIIGSKTGGYGFAIQKDAAPLDMSTANIPEGGFLVDVLRAVADEEQWP
jgi:hypothetical protein